MSKHKHSWSLEGLDSDGVLLFHRQLAKLWDKPKEPYIDEHNGHTRTIPSDITFNTVHETKEDYKLFFDYLKKSKAMFLRLHGVNNEIFETWKLEDLSLVQVEALDELEALIDNTWTWDLFYKKLTFNSVEIS